jgi:thioredoxin 1
MENSKSLEVEINGNNFKQEVLESSIPVLVDFWAPWCMPCRMLEPIIEKLAEESTLFFNFLTLIQLRK